MGDQALRIRVQRLLGGTWQTDDLARLFLYARDRCDGRESVREVGDFVAHHEERTKGIAHRTTTEWVAIAKFKLSRLGTTIDLGKLPPLFS